MIKNNRNIERIIIIILFLILGIGINYHFNKKSKLNDKYEQQVKLTEALTDSIRLYMTDNGELISEKRTIQGNLNDLRENNQILSKSQKELLNTVDRINRERKRDREIFAAAQIKYMKLIDSLNRVIANATNIDTVNNIVSFVENDTGAHFIYNIDINNVRPYPKYKSPNLVFNKIDFPNTQTITFNFDKNKRKDYPVSFSVMNTNPYYKPLNIESYAIEGIKKENVNPKGWKKVWNWIKINGKYILVGTAGFAIGVTAAQ